MINNNDIKVSVIIYVKNTVQYIEQCIKSIMKQTLHEIEILIIDGGSTDGTRDIIDKLKKEDMRICVFHTVASVGKQFNLGLQKAKGQYIGICEADDYILPDMYEKQYQIANENQLDIIRADYYQVCKINGIEYRFKVQACYQKDLKEQMLEFKDETFFVKQRINGFWNGLYRRKFLLEHQIWMNETEGAAYQDISFSFFSQMYAKRVWFMNEAFYCYRIDNPTASANFLHGIELHMKEYNELKKRLININKWKQYKNIFFSWELISFRWFLGELPQLFKNENAAKVYRYLKRQNEENEYDGEQIIETVKDLANVFFINENSFLKIILYNTDKKEKLLRYFMDIFKEEKLIILFGIGYLGKIVKLSLELCEKNILLIDNNKLLQKEGINETKIYNPEEVVKKYPKERYIIASICHSRQMEKQLIDLGVCKEKIIICDDEEFFLRRIFANAGQYIGKNHC